MLSKQRTRPKSRLSIPDINIYSILTPKISNSRLIYVLLTCIFLVSMRILHSVPIRQNAQPAQWTQAWEWDTQINFLPLSMENEGNDNNLNLIHIVHATDATRIKLVLVSIYSILETAVSPERFRFHIVNTGSPLSIQKEWIEGCFPLQEDQIEIVHWDGQKHLSNVKVYGARSSLRNAANFARFHLGDIFPQLERVIYLDADTLAIRSIEKIWAVDLGGMPLGMSVRQSKKWFSYVFHRVFNATHPIVMETFANELSLNPGPDQDMNPINGNNQINGDIGMNGNNQINGDIGMKGVNQINGDDEINGGEEVEINGEFYPNAGMILMDLAAMKKFRVREKVQHMIDVNFKEFMYSSGSQAPLVLAVWNNFVHLPEEWNTMNHRNIRNATILHFTGPSLKAKIQKRMDTLLDSPPECLEYDPSVVSFYTEEKKAVIWKYAACALAHVCASDPTLANPFVDIRSQ